MESNLREAESKLSVAEQRADSREKELRAAHDKYVEDSLFVTVWENMHLVNCTVTICKFCEEKGNSCGLFCTDSLYELLESVKKLLNSAEENQHWFVDS